MDKKQRAKIYKQNSQASTGPKTPEGKERSSYNSYKHGLDSKRLVRTEDESALFAEILATIEREYQPSSLIEHDTTHGLAEMQWQLLRIRRLLEMAFFRGGDLWETSKTIENYSKHQMRAQKQYDSYMDRMLLLMAARDEEQNGRQSDPKSGSKGSKPKQPSLQLLRRPPANPMWEEDLPANGFVPTEPVYDYGPPPVDTEEQP